ncbi:MAG: fibrobacter succinogenes major paralogous domain-containing protein, partial [Bacteroidales bacterium]|nr:fibrobacter succinogenes major paralogous domain-containing protein [Bacteroidales bacterium]
MQLIPVSGKFAFLIFLFLVALVSATAQQIADADGNSYNTVTIGNQVWLAENLKTTKLSDGTPITYANGSQALQIFTPSYTWFGYDETATKRQYGALYNWYSVETKELCPSGWHVPSDKDWTELSDFLEKNAFGFDGSGNDIAKSLASKSGWIVSQEPGT